MSGVSTAYSANEQGDLRYRSGSEAARRQLVFYLIAKRCFDLIAAGLLLILLSPVFLIVAIWVRLDSPGPVIFAQKRIGCRYRRAGGYLEYELYEFTFYKFRSMHHKAGDTFHREFIRAYIQNDLNGMDSLQGIPVTGCNRYKLNGDRRITRAGHILRKTSLDELPQLWNVLIGDMSLVGPRPAIPYEVEMYQPDHFQRLYSLPGITGLWQIKARSSVSFEEMVRLDIEYIHNRGFWYDLKILLLTPFAVMINKGT